MSAPAALGLAEADEAAVAIAARTALASSHDVHVTVRGRHLTHGLGLIDDDGEPLIVSAHADLPTGAARVAVTSDRSDLAGLVLEGTLVPLSESERADALALLQEHAGCLGLGEGKRIRLQRLAVTSVAVSMPHPRPGRPQVLRPVALASYARAQPDPWVLFGAAMLRHLNHEHSVLLGALAARVSGSRSALGWAHRIGPAGIGLRVVDSTGATEHDVAFRVPVTSPLGIPDELTRLAPGSPHYGCR